MRKPATAKNPGRQTIAGSDTKGAPVLGWNAEDPQYAVRDGEAIILDNWFPRKSYLETRPGNAAHYGGFALPVETVMAYHGNTVAGNKLFAATDGGVWDATAAGSAGASVATITNGRMQHTVFSTQAGNFLVAVNGTDLLQIYNGIAWQAVSAVSVPIAITGLVTSTFVHVNAYKRRLFFVIKDKLSFAYLPPATLGGAAAEFPLEGIFKKGGYLMAMGTWTLDAGNGSDDHAVFITSEGEVAVYTGTDPGVAANWSLVGVFALAKPISRRCMCQLGGDLLLVLRDGIYPVSAALLSSSISRQIAITKKVDNAWQNSAKLYQGSFGWCAYVFKEAPFLLCNVPGLTSVDSVQYVMNTTTKAWTRFTGIGGVDFAVLGTELYMCRGREVCKMWTGTSDFNQDITFRSKAGFSNFGYQGNIKQWTTLRPVVEFSGVADLLVGIDTDFKEEDLSGTVTPVVDPSSIYDIGLWDTGIWGGESFLSQGWITVSAEPGYYGATKLQFTSSTITARWFVTNYIFQVGGLM